MIPAWRTLPADSGSVRSLGTERNSIVAIPAARFHPLVCLLNGVQLPASVIRRSHVPVFCLPLKVKHSQRGEGDAIGFNRSENLGELHFRSHGGWPGHAELANEHPRVPGA